MKWMIKPLALLLLAGTVCAQQPVAVEVHATKDMAVRVRQDTTEKGITKYVITRGRNTRPVILTTQLIAADGRILHTHTDRMGRRAEVAWASQAEAKRLIVVVEKR